LAWFADPFRPLSVSGTASKVLAVSRCERKTAGRFQQRWSADRYSQKGAIALLPVARINADVQEILRDPAFQGKKVREPFLPPMLGTPQALAAYLAAE
jgi:hypothetical protein